MVQFSELPNDVIIDRRRHVLPPKDMDSFAQVSRTTYACATPVLKQCKDLRTKYETINHKSGVGGSTYYQLLKDTLVQPHIAHFVKEIRFTCWQNRGEDLAAGNVEAEGLNAGDRVRHLPYSNEDMELFGQAIHEARQLLPIWGEWPAEVQAGNEDSVIALLLTMLPTLE